MRLYSIRNTHTGLFFLCTDWRNKLHWSTSPIFWKTIDGVVANLRRIGGERNKRHESIDATSFDATRLRGIEVIITDVSIHGEKTLAAADFFVGAAA